MKELKNLEAIRELLASHPIYTYDYSPSQVEAILFGILQLTPEHQDYIITGLKNIFGNLSKTKNKMMT